MLARRHEASGELEKRLNDMSPNRDVKKRSSEFLSMRLAAKQGYSPSSVFSNRAHSLGQLLNDEDSHMQSPSHLFDFRLESHIAEDADGEQDADSMRYLNPNEKFLANQSNTTRVSKNSFINSSELLSFERNGVQGMAAVIV